MDLGSIQEMGILGKRMAEETVKSFTMLCRKYVAEI